MSTDQKQDSPELIAAKEALLEATIAQTDAWSFRHGITDAPDLDEDYPVHMAHKEAVRRRNAAEDAACAAEGIPTVLEAADETKRLARAKVNALTGHTPATPKAATPKKVRVSNEMEALLASLPPADAPASEWKNYHAKLAKERAAAEAKEARAKAKKDAEWGEPGLDDDNL